MSEVEEILYLAKALHEFFPGTEISMYVGRNSQTLTAGRRFITARISNVLDDLKGLKVETNNAVIAGHDDLMLLVGEMASTLYILARLIIINVKKIRQEGRAKEVMKFIDNVIALLNPAIAELQKAVNVLAKGG